MCFKDDIEGGNAYRCECGWEGIGEADLQECPNCGDPVVDVPVDPIGSPDTEDILDIGECLPGRSSIFEVVT